MSDQWFNLRIAWFHLQCQQGYFFKWKIVANEFWKERNKWLHAPIALYEFRPRGIFGQRSYLAHGAQGSAEGEGK